MDDRLDELERRVRQIERRNERAERDKAWETSWVRRLVITTLTYLVIVGYFAGAGLPTPFINAVVPAVAYVLASATLPWFQVVWLRYLYDPDADRPHGGVTND